MRLEIGLFAGLKCANPDLPFCGQTDFCLEVPEGISLCELRDILRLDPLVPILYMVNNHQEQAAWVPKDNDRIAMFPPIGGG